MVDVAWAVAGFWGWGLSGVVGMGAVIDVDLASLLVVSVRRCRICSGSVCWLKRVGGCDGVW